MNPAVSQQFQPVGPERQYEMLEPFILALGFLEIENLAIEGQGREIQRHEKPHVAKSAMN